MVFFACASLPLLHIRHTGGIPLPSCTSELFYITKLEQFRNLFYVLLVDSKYCNTMGILQY